MARTWRGISTSRHNARTSITAGTVMASHSGGQRHQPSCTNTRGRLRIATITRFPMAHSTKRTVTYFGETRSHWTPGGSIASVRIFAFAFCFPAAGFRSWSATFEVFRWDSAEPLDHQAHDHHHHAPTAHQDGVPEDAFTTAQGPDSEKVKGDAGVPAQKERPGICAGLGKDQRPRGQ